MAADDQHCASVDAWLARIDDGLPPEQWLEIFASGFDAVWQRSHRTLGEVTLMAIIDRVLHNAAERYPALAVLKVEANGLQRAELNALILDLDPGGLRSAVRFVLLEFLTILGVLTAEILTPALHAELSKLAPEKFRRTHADALKSRRKESKP